MGGWPPDNLPGKRGTSARGRWGMHLRGLRSGGGFHKGLLSGEPMIMGKARAKSPRRGRTDPVSHRGRQRGIVASGKWLAGLASWGGSPSKAPTGLTRTLGRRLAPEGAKCGTVQGGALRASPVLGFRHSLRSGVPRDLMAPLGGVLEVEISWLPCPEQRSPRGQPKDLLGIAARTLLPAGRGARVTGASRTWRFWAHSGGVSACAHRPRTSPSSAHSVATCARTRRPHRVIEGTPRTRRLSSHPSDTAADLNLRTANILQSSFLWRKLLPPGNLAKPKTK